MGLQPVKLKGATMNRETMRKQMEDIRGELNRLDEQEEQDIISRWTPPCNG